MLNASHFRGERRPILKTFMTSREDYLKAIYLLSRQNTVVRSVDLAAYLGFSKASISRAVALLSKEGYLGINGHELCLTEKGRSIAILTYEK